MNSWQWPLRVHDRTSTNLLKKNVPTQTIAGIINSLVRQQVLSLLYILKPSGHHWHLGSFDSEETCSVAMQPPVVGIESKFACCLDVLHHELHLCMKVLFFTFPCHNHLSFPSLTKLHQQVLDLWSWCTVAVCITDVRRTTAHPLILLFLSSLTVPHFHSIYWEVTPPPLPLILRLCQRLLLSPWWNLEWRLNGPRTHLPHTAS